MSAVALYFAAEPDSSQQAEDMNQEDGSTGLTHFL